MTVEELREMLIRDLEPAFFVGGFGGAMVEIEEIKRASDEEVIEIARKKGYQISIKQESDKQKRKWFLFFYGILFEKAL